VIGQKETASSCTRAGLDQVLGKNSSPSGLSSIGQAAHGSGQRYLKDV